MLQPGQQIQRLQAIDPESLEEVVVGSKFLAWNFELGRRKIKYFVKSSLSIRHSCSHSIRNLVMASRAARRCFPRTFSNRPPPPAGPEAHKTRRFPASIRRRGSV